MTTALSGLPEPRSVSGCDTCTTARCCTTFEPELTGADVVRLCDGLGVAPREVAQLKPVRADQAGPDGIRFGREPTAGTWDLRLRSLGDKRCVWLDARRRCAAYAHRPLACRLFPSELTATGVRVWTPEAICPPAAWDEERADLTTLELLHRVGRAERERFRAFVARWNAQAHEAADGAAREAMFLAALVADTRAAGDQPSK